MISNPNAITSVTLDDIAHGQLLAQALLDLNNANAVELSWLDADRLRYLVSRAMMVRRVGYADALMLAFDQDADYDSPNFQWFRSTGRRFAYMDRIVVAAHARRRGLAVRLYRDLFDHALAAGHTRVACEVNCIPPNPASEAFHAALGFEEVGRASIHGGVKTVRYLEKRIDQAVAA